jgi:predicted amidohydrolase YtcJ
MGSDWPVSSADPMAAIHVAVNRIRAGAPPGTPALGADQTLPLAAALRAYTAGSAAVNHLDGRSGTIAPGYDADLVLLDRNPFEHPITELCHTRVERTYADGAEVYRADST